MSKVNRKYYSSSYLHIMVQGINKEDIFKHEIYKKLYLKLLQKYLNEFNVNLLAYVVMDNHAHMLIHYKNIEELSKFMSKVNQNFAQIYNKHEERVGYVFRSRYKCKEIVDMQYLYVVLAYIHFNPYKANIVSKLSDYKFSSYNNFINKKISKEDAYFLFKTDKYENIFADIHKQYFEKYINRDEFYKKIINDFIEINDVESYELIKKDDVMLMKLIDILKNKTQLSDRKICKLLNIGKNRITTLRKKIK